MWGKKVQGSFNAGEWCGQVDVKRAIVTLSMLIGLGILWFGLARLVMVQI
ncbi:MAG: hypothetical protein AAF412_10565 [Pseudomonadota bacterium]